MPDFLKWLNGNAAAVQAISSVVILVLTGVLIYVTHRYRKDTEKMAAETARLATDTTKLANVAAQQLELATQPVVSFGITQAEVRGNDWEILAVRFNAYNNGQLWVTVDSAKVTYWLNGFEQQAGTEQKPLGGGPSAQVSAGDATTIDFSLGIDPQPKEARDPDKGLMYRVEVVFRGADVKQRQWESGPRNARYRSPA